MISKVPVAEKTYCLLYTHAFRRPENRQALSLLIASMKFSAQSARRPRKKFHKCTFKLPNATNFSMLLYSASEYEAKDTISQLDVKSASNVDKISNCLVKLTSKVVVSVVKTLSH